MTDTGINNLNGIDRVVRFFIGCCLIGSVMLSPVNFELIVLLPLFGIYPCLTAIFGWDPVYYVFGINKPKLEKLIQEQIDNSRLLAPRTV